MRARGARPADHPRCRRAGSKHTPSSEGG